jgi:hypothetical protein
VDRRSFPEDRQLTLTAILAEILLKLLRYCGKLQLLQKGARPVKGGIHVQGKTKERRQAQRKEGRRLGQK